MAVQPANKRSQQILGGISSQNENVAAARNVVTAFERMWGAIRVMAENHPSRQRSLQLFLDVVKGYTEKFGALRLEVTPHTFGVDGHEVFRLDRPNENYVYRLYQDGIRELSFTEELSLTELERFVQILFASFSDRGSAEDDLVTLLWDADLQTILYGAIDTIDEASDEPSDDLAQPKASPAERGGVAGGRAFVSPKEALAIHDIVEKAVAAAAMPSDLSSFSEQVAESGAPALAEVSGFPDEVQQERVERPVVPGGTGAYPVVEMQDLSIRLRENQALVERKFGEIVFKAFQALGPAAAKPVVKAFREFTLHTFHTQQDDDPVIDIFGAFGQTNGSPEEARTRREILAGIDSPEFIDLLVQRLAPARLSEKLIKLVQFIGSDLFPSLWDGMTRVKGINHQATLRELLTPFAGSHARYLLEKLSQSDADAAALALHMLRKANFTPKAEDLRAGLEHPSPVVRIEVAKMLPTLNDPLAQHMMLPRMLRDPDEEVRSAVLRILVQTGGLSLEDHLVDVMRKGLFHTRTEEEKRFIMAALSRVATGKSLPVLRDMAVPWGPQASKWDHKTRVTAIRLLGRVGNQIDLKDLDILARKFFVNKEIKAAAGEATKMIRRRNGGN